MTITVLDPLVLRVARRYVSDVHNADPHARLVLDQRPAIEIVAREYQRRGEGLVPMDGEEEKADDNEEAEAIVDREAEHVAIHPSTIP